MVHYHIEELIAIGCVQKPTESSSAHSYQTRFSGIAFSMGNLGQLG